MTSCCTPSSRRSSPSTGLGSVGAAITTSRSGPPSGADVGQHGRGQLDRRGRRGGGHGAPPQGRAFGARTDLGAVQAVRGDPDPRGRHLDAEHVAGARRDRVDDGAAARRTARGALAGDQAELGQARDRRGHRRFGQRERLSQSRSGRRTVGGEGAEDRPGAVRELAQAQRAVDAHRLLIGCSAGSPMAHPALRVRRETGAGANGSLAQSLVARAKSSLTFRTFSGRCASGRVGGCRHDRTRPPVRLPGRPGPGHRPGRHQDPVRAGARRPDRGRSSWCPRPSGAPATWPRTPSRWPVWCRSSGGRRRSAGPWASARTAATAPSSAPTMEAELRRHFAGPVAVVNDAELMPLAMGVVDGIGLVAGTGSIAVARDRHGRADHRRRLGLGARRRGQRRRHRPRGRARRTGRARLRPSLRPAGAGAAGRLRRRRRSGTGHGRDPVQLGRPLGQPRPHGVHRGRRGIRPRRRGAGVGRRGSWPG